MSGIRESFSKIDLSVVLPEQKSPLELAIERNSKHIAKKFFNKKDGCYVLKDDAPDHMRFSYSSVQFDPASIKFPGYPFLMSLAQNPMIRNGVQRIANDMTKNWGKLQATNNDTKSRVFQIESALNKLSTQDIFHKAQVANGYYGGALVYIEVLGNDGSTPSDDELKTPIWDNSNPEFSKIKLAGKIISRLKVIEPWNFTALGYNTTDPTHADFYEPTYYMLYGKQIHASRFLVIKENYCPQILQPIYNFLGIPTAQLAFDYAWAFESSRKAITKLIRKYSLLIFGTDIKPDENAINPLSFITKRIGTVAKFRDNDDVVIYDKETEELGQINTPISGLDTLWTKQLELMTIPFQLPMVKLLGASPSGFSTGETELTNYYDSVSTNQVSVFRREIEKLAQMLNYTIKDGGKQYADTIDFSFVFNPIKSTSEKEISELNKMQSENDAILLDMNVISAAEIRSRISKSEISDYNGIDIDDIPDPVDPNGGVQGSKGTFGSLF